MTVSFVKQADFKVEYSPSHIRKWISRRTGLQVALIQQESPTVNGYFAVATEIENDSGSPHTLEHLIFTGSRKYPYRGLLDVLSNVTFSSTNAWTATDSTVYTLDTAGWDGFKMLLPVYLDHVLNPTLTENACYTEVYHVDGDGLDKGVVYSEMQGVENTSEFQADLADRRAMFSEKSGYSSETGGLLNRLRVLTNDEIRSFHKLRYRPDNLCIIITGIVDPEELLTVIEPFDNELPTLNGRNYRPFVDAVRELPPTKDTIQIIEFPDEDESVGDILISWMGPEYSNILDDLAIDILGSYLTESSIDPLQREIVEIDDPLANYVSIYPTTYVNNITQLSLGGVPTEKLKECEFKVNQVIKSQTILENFDLNRIKDIVESSKLKYILQAEKSSNSLAESIISDFLYGKEDGSELKSQTADLKEYDILSNWTSEQWINILRKYFVENKHISTLSKPSKELYEKSQVDEKKRIETRKLKLGKDGLEKLKKKLEETERENNQEIPKEITDLFQTPDPSKIHFINTEFAETGLGSIINEGSNIQKLITNNTPKDFKLSTHFEHYPSEFVQIRAIFPTNTVPIDLLPYIDVIISELLFSLPIEFPTGEKLSFEEVISKLSKDIVNYYVFPSFTEQFSEYITITFISKRENYKKSIKWLKDILFYTKFDKSRIKVAINNYLNGLPDKKRSASTMLDSIMTRTILNDKSMKRAKDILSTEDFVFELLDDIETEFESIVEDLEKVRSSLFSLDNARILVCGNIEKLEDPVKSLTLLTDNKDIKITGPPKIIHSLNFLTEKGKSLSGEANIIAVPGTESSFLIAVTKGPTDYTDEDLPALRLAASYLQAVEGPFWKGIRGAGLAYGANARQSVELGQIGFEIYRGTDGYKAFNTAKKLVEDLANGVTPIDDILYRGSLSSIINSIASRENDYFSTSVKNYQNQVFIGRDRDYNTKSIEKLKNVDSDQLRNSIKKYFEPIFNSKTGIVFVACHPSAVEEFEKNFKNDGFEVNIEVVTNDSDSESGSESGCESHDHDHNHNHNHN